VIYRAFGDLRHRLGRPNEAPLYPYMFSDTPFSGSHPDTPSSNYDPRHG
jgi:2,5-furandicarboxylate decarboxylase 1